MMNIVLPKELLHHMFSKVYDVLQMVQYFLWSLENRNVVIELPNNDNNTQILVSDLTNNLIAELCRSVHTEVKQTHQTC